MIPNFLKTAWADTAALSLTAFTSPMTSLLSLRSPRDADGLLYHWGRGMMRAAGATHTSKGLEHLPEGNVVFVCNHQSNYDVILFFAHVRKHTRWVAKRELFKVPVFGTTMRLAGNIPVDRDGSESDKSRLSEAVVAVRERVSVMFFPEGTRNSDGKLKPFKKGAAVFGIQAGVPIVPMAVSGTRNILPKGSLAIRYGQKAALVVGEPIHTQGLTLDDREALTHQLEQTVARLYAEACELSGDKP
ncbi:lysophospholipid acyltransferase family protein [Hyalangium rubrum]|uniref:1-acyl-sn-glycerol-3-phosphate acyltransferase n=1 Tax=Hyalangium rubrum TaxID=3103134 RepID=A0ABU5H746_9BACT|nr:lysophospholipid acyltransferase family protein [Hyalangium sp. s54d21]MDY7228704.1 lysophospholipid acyltransferase family protein [Hyalangium sp. s54d21]